MAICSPPLVWRPSAWDGGGTETLLLILLLGAVTVDEPGGRNGQTEPPVRSVVTKEAIVAIKRTLQPKMEQPHGGEAVKESPIVFSGDMVRAILEGRKTQTRRAIKPQPPWGEPWFNGAWWLTQSAGVLLKKQPPRVGDLLWVRETWCKADEGIYYKADCRHPLDSFCIGEKWRPSIHMPHRYSRITLKVTGVRAEKLRDISDADLLAEGISKTESCNSKSFVFSEYWNSLDTKASGYTWYDNPWVWVITFKQLEVRKCR